MSAAIFGFATRAVYITMIMCVAMPTLMEMHAQLARHIALYCDRATGVTDQEACRCSEGGGLPACLPAEVEVLPQKTESSWLKPKSGFFAEATRAPPMSGRDVEDEESLQDDRVSCQASSAKAEPAAAQTAEPLGRSRHTLAAFERFGGDLQEDEPFEERKESIAELIAKIDRLIADVERLDEEEARLRRHYGL